MGSSSLRRVALTVMAVCVTGLALAVLVLAGYGWFAARDIEERFDGRKWRIPSRVYSDTTLLYPGQSISRDLLEERLTHLGYRPVKHAPRQQGRMRVKQDRIEVFLNDLRMPHRYRVGFPAAIGLGGKTIDSILDMRTGEKVPILELEPEELWQFFGPEREERRLVSIEQIPMHVRQAVLAAEDARFYQHFGLDLHGIGRAMLANLRSLAVAQGGSTITQQLAKNYFLTPVGQDGEAWLPQNFSPVSEERLRLREALAQSVNRPAVDLAMRVGLKKVINTAADFGISTPMRPYPSLALGAFEVIPLELARAYCPFAADGMLPYPLSLKDVVDEEGHVLEGRHTTIRQVTSPARAYLMSSLLRSVVERGTASTLRGMGITRPVAGKTGTSDKYRDAWFVGYTPDILALVWVGADDGSPIWETGASAALPIWADLMEQVPEYLSGGWFRRPPGVVEKVVCSQSGKLAVRGACPQPLRELFLEGQTPEQACPLHRRGTLLERFYRGVHDALQ